jgi:CHAD domain-containing protein
MKKKEEARFLDKEWHAMNLHLKAFRASGDQEELHRLRVQIKKLRAMLSLFEDASGKPGLLRDFKPVKKIFKQAGIIREAHINLQLSERYQLKNDAFESGQQKIMEEGTSEFKQSGKKFIRNLKESYGNLKKQLPRVHNSSIAEYYKKQLQEIAVNFTVLGFNEEMHTNRKLIKILVYNHQLAESALNGSVVFNSDYLDKLQNAIGEWHDNLVAAELFSTPELNDIPVVAKINRKNAGVKRKITTLADDFFKKATTAVPEIAKTS